MIVDRLYVFLILHAAECAWSVFAGWLLGTILLAVYGLVWLAAMAGFASGVSFGVGVYTVIAFWPERVRRTKPAR